MKIIYKEDPLATVVELDEQETEILRLKIKLEQYEEMIFSAHWSLTRSAEYLAGLPRPQTIEQAREEAIKELDPEYWCDDGNKLDARVDELLKHYVEELKGYHVGDCTCFPASCSKCHAESILGIDTIKGLGKHPGHKIYSMFNYKDGETWKTRGIDEVLEMLRTYEPKADWAGWEDHVPRWKAEGQRAYEWLLKYKEEHLDSHN